MKNWLSILLFLVTNNLLSQTWSKHYDFDIGNDYATHAVPVEEGVILQVIGLCDLNSIECRGLLKLDFDGNFKWKTILYDTLEWNGLRALVIREDTILLNMDYIWGPLSDKDFSVLSFDLQGNYITRFDFEQQVPYASRDLLLRPDGKVLTQFDIRHPVTNRIIEYTRCYSQNWNLLWEIHTPETGTLNSTKSIVSLDTGLVLGYTHWPGGGQILKFNVEKYDKNGQLQWHTQYPYEAENSGQVIKINALPDGSFVGAFGSDTFGLLAANVEIWFKLDANGNHLWEKATIYEERFIYHTFINQDGNIIACGEMADYHFDTIDDPNLSAYIMCMNPDGERLWERKILNKTTGVYTQQLYGGTELPNGDLVFVGEIWDTIPTPENPTYQDIWVIKTDKDGCFTPGCGEWQTLVPVIESPPVQAIKTFGIFPNPASEYVYLASKMGEIIPDGSYSVRVYDSSGRFITAQNIDPLVLNRIGLETTAPGVFTVALFRNGLLFQTLKGIKK
ncbi:MAG: hypothetical protein JNJ57_08365 [Saprospiraceae bacterium]|nr:hypothetical protein [Saprospiraceae bacterium]